MTQETKDRIEQQARAFLIKHNETKPPINPETLAQREGLTVVYDYILGNRVGELNRETKQIVVDEYLKNDLPYAHCVIAHELGHYVLNVGAALTASAGKAPETSADESELEANYFAHALLMPKPLVEKAVKKYNNKKETSFDTLIDYICYMFCVTERKAKHRLEECGLG